MPATLGLVTSTDRFLESCPPFPLETNPKNFQRFERFSGHGFGGDVACLHHDGLHPGWQPRLCVPRAPPAPRYSSPSGTPASAQKGRGRLGLQLGCLPALTPHAGIHGHPGLYVLGVGLPAAPPTWEAPSCPASQAICSGSVPCSAEMTPPSLASPAPRSCPRTSLVAQ